MPGGQVRIIAGSWRGRRIHFSDNIAIRPTPDRLRETVFNWLNPYLPGSRCCDLFAGTGALGFEALSRGATDVTLIDQSTTAIQAMMETAKRFASQHHRLIQGQSPKAFTQLDGPPFDIVFIDPPYNSPLLENTLIHLKDSPLISADTLFYIEFAYQQAPESLAEFTAVKRKHTQRIDYGLYRLTQASRPR